MKKKITVEKIRVSLGSTSVLGLNKFLKLKETPITCYLMTFYEGHCIGNCSFCPQSKESNSSIENLSRINWPIYPFDDFLSSLKMISPLKKFHRVCIQTLNYPQNFQDLIEIITQIKKVSDLPISVAIPPLSKDKLLNLKSIGVERAEIALDGATPEIFNDFKGGNVKGPYNWEKQIHSLKNAIEIYSKGFVTTHIIVGLGESQKEILDLVEELHNLSILTSLFAFMPIQGTKCESMARPNIIDFRKVQLGRYLIMYENKNTEDFAFNSKGDLVNFNLSERELKNIVFKGVPFMTSGCPGCNRPYYTSRPSGPMFNYPRKLSVEETEEIFNTLRSFCN